MYQRITGENPYEVPMRIYPAVHYTMGGLWVDYDLQSTIPGLFVTGEANFSDHGANRLGASRADAGPRRRLLRAAAHDPRLPRQGPVREARREPPGGRRGAGRRSRPACTKLPVDQRRPLGRLLPQGARQHHVGVLRHGALRGGPAQGHRPHPRPARRVLAQRQGARRGRHASTRASRRPAASPTSSSSAS